MEFRQLTLERLQKFVAQQYFVTKDYLDGECAAAELFHYAMKDLCDAYLASHTAIYGFTYDMNHVNGCCLQPATTCYTSCKS